MTEAIVREYNVGRFRGNFPDVETAAEVDMESIRKRDADPMFVTLPIAEIGSVSGNGLLYDAPLVDSIAEQINAKRPGGIFGHLKDEDRSISFPLPAGLWIGAKRVGQTLWAKAYIPPGAARDYVQNLKDVGGEIATSIYGKGKFEKVRDGVKRLLNFNLESLDFAPPARAALGMGAIPHVTSEMNQREEAEMPEVTKTIQELQNAKVAPVSGWNPVQQQQAAGDATVAELTSRLSALADRNTVLETTVQEFQRREFERAVEEAVAEYTNWNVGDTEKDANGKTAKDKLNALRGMFRRAILAKVGSDQKVESIAEIAAATWDDEIKSIAETIRDALAGPAAIVRGRVQQTNAAPKLEDTPENRAKARADMGI